MKHTTASLLLKAGVQCDHGVWQQLALIDIAIQQVDLEEDAQNLLQVLLTDSCGNFER